MSWFAVELVFVFVDMCVMMKRGKDKAPSGFRKVIRNCGERDRAVLIAYLMFAILSARSAYC